MRYDTLMTIRVSPETAAAIAEASAARGLKRSEYLRNAISLSLAMDSAIHTESPSTCR
jgi:predicted DNA binding CopG/RHH family protein